MSQSTMTLKPLQLNLENLTSSQVGSPAKIYQLQAYKQASRKKPDQVSFLNSCESYAWLDPNTLSWKTWQRSLIEGWTSYSGNFPKQGTMQNGQLYQQVLWEPATKDQDGGSLPTPTTMDHLPQRGFDSMVKQTTQHRKGRTKLANLREAVNPETVQLFNKLQSLPTPVARDYKGRTSKKWNERYGPKVLPDVLTQAGDRMSLNPSFVEEMMGYEVGWTDLKH